MCVLKQTDIQGVRDRPSIRRNWRTKQKDTENFVVRLKSSGNYLIIFFSNAGIFGYCSS